MTSFPTDHEADGCLADSWRKEDISVTYLHALAAVIGVSCDHGIRDINGWDVHLAATDTEDSDPLQLHVQLKCTVNRLSVIDGGAARSFPLPKSNYDQLRKTPCHPPRILVVVELPSHWPVSWAQTAESELLVNGSAWFVNLRGEPAVPEGQNNVSVRIPSDQRLTPEALLAEMRAFSPNG